MDAFKRLQKRDVTFSVDRPAMVSVADSFIDPSDEIMTYVKLWYLFLSSHQETLNLYIRKMKNVSIDGTIVYISPCIWIIQASKTKIVH